MIRRFQLCHHDAPNPEESNALPSAPSCNLMMTDGSNMIITPNTELRTLSKMKCSESNLIITPNSELSTFSKLKYNIIVDLT